MPRGKKLTEEEIGKVIAYHDTKMSHREIARRIGRSRSVVKRCLNDPVAYSAYKPAGRPTVLTDMARRRLLRAAHKGQLSARELQAQLELTVSVSRVKQLLKESLTLKFVKRKHAPVLTENHKKLVLNGVLRELVFPMTTGLKLFFGREEV
ncbi:hypothetical protein KXD40_000283 [Peronospora effusa]|nr:hypothetical protein KXD40_000283 [Peronospora effusa]